MVRITSFAACSSLLASFVSARFTNTTVWPNGPFVTVGRDVHNAVGENVTYAGVNWPGAGEVMIPEGLQYQSIATIVSKIKTLGMNAIRLTYSIELIDQIYDNGGEDITVQTAFLNALGEANGTKVFNELLAQNPSFNASTTRLQIFDAIAAEAASQHIYIHLDNHISKGMWCCNTEDGNSWFGDTYYDVGNWTRGLAYMATHGKKWGNMLSVSLRNELRSPDNNPELLESSYNWQDWYKFIKQGTEAIHAANPDVLIYLSGLGFDTNLSPIVRGTALTPGTEVFSFDDFSGYANKLVLELHNYQTTATNCSSVQNGLYNNGWEALVSPDAKNKFPVVMTEFGFLQNATTWQGVYATCIADYLSKNKAGWMIWALSGSYYIRQETQDYEETWGLLNHDWSDWRSPEYIEGGLKPLVEATREN